MIRVLCALLLTMILAASAWAGAVDDLNAGLAAAKNGRHDEAIALLTRALDAGGLSGDEQVAASKTRGAEYMTKSLMADAFGRRDEGRRLRTSAAADFTSALDRKPQDPELLVERGHTYHVNRQYEQAVADFDAALRLKPSIVTRLQRAASLRAKGDVDRALADYTTALDAKDSSIEQSDIYNERGYAQFIAGRFDEAAADFEKALLSGAPSRGSDVLWMPYQVAWLHIARARAGRNDADELAANAAKVNLDQWPGSLIAFFLGKIKAADIGASSSHGSMGRSRACNIAFFVGQASLAKGDTADAERRFREVQGTCNIHTINVLVAEFELRRIRK